MFRPPPAPPLSAPQRLERAQRTAPPLRRRLAAFLYEGVLLFGVVMLAGMVFGIATGQRHALHGREGLQATLFLVLSLYFIWFWVHGGQTLAMKTWYLQLVGNDGRPVPLARAAGRYVLSWLWFLPSLALAWLAQWHHGPTIAALVVVWVLLYAGLSFLMPRRQFVHDRICGTCLIDTRPDPTSPAVPPAVPSGDSPVTLGRNA